MSVLLLGCGVIGAVLFVTVFLLDGATRPGYRPTDHPVSALSLGARGWLQTANFVVTGLLMVAAAVGVRMVWQTGRGALLVPVLLGVFGVALLLSGVFRMDPMRGYPPGAPHGTPEDLSRAHRWHDNAGLLVFTSLPAACFASAWRFADEPAAGWAIYSAVAGAIFVVLFFRFGVAWERASPGAGLLQRLTIVVGWSWVALVCSKLIAAS